MPWTAAEFKSKHAKNLTNDQAAKAASIANAIMKSGGDEGIAIATGIKKAKELAASDDGQWMQDAFSKNKGKLHRRLGVPKDEKIPQDELRKAAKSDDPSLRKEAQLALNAQARVDTNITTYTNLRRMVTAELAADAWWDSLTKHQKELYLKAHKNSKYGVREGNNAVPLHKRPDNPYPHNETLHTRLAQYHGDKAAYHANNAVLSQAHRMAAKLHKKASSALHGRKADARKISNAAHRFSEINRL